MINLIPNEEKKEIKNNFYCRLLAVLFIVISISFFIVTVLILPSYLISLEKKNSILRKLEIQKSEIMPAVDKKAEDEIRDLNNRLSSIEKSIDNKYVFTQKIINEIISRKIFGIKIRRISYQGDEFSGRSITVNGTAISREQLLLFRKAFENTEIFKSVDLPISNFVKGRDIEFSLYLRAL